ncbi:MAG: metallophosphoesterase [Maricaulis sp.]|nr:metallophosphoesterase [Maricaulis sp.]
MLSFVIGDVHGEFRKFIQLYGAIHEHRLLYPDDEYRIVFLGDYCDRGPDSKKVIDFLLMLDSEHHVLLPGNHEDLLAGFIEYCDEGDTDCDDWLKSGGVETLRSYCGRDHPIQSTSKPDHQTILDARSMIPESHVRFFNDLINTPTPWHLDRDNGLLFVHAGINMKKKLEDQTYEECLWSRFPAFLNDSGDEWVEPYTVVHGHTPDENWTVRGKGNRLRIGVDTGACYGGDLTAAVFQNADLKGFIRANNQATRYQQYKPS